MVSESGWAPKQTGGPINRHSDSRISDRQTSSKEGVELLATEWHSESELFTEAVRSLELVVGILRQLRDKLRLNECPVRIIPLIYRRREPRGKPGSADSLLASKKRSDGQLLLRQLVNLLLLQPLTDRIADETRVKSADKVRVVITYLT